MDAEDYINDEERFNITHRIELLFPKMDISPADSFVSVEELAEWNFQLALKEILHRAGRDMEMHDMDKDGFVSLAEYDASSWPRRSQEGENTSSNMGWWKVDHFNASDRDRNGLLNLTEFNDFLNPAYSDNPELVHWLCKEEIRFSKPYYKPYSSSIWTLLACRNFQLPDALLLSYNSVPNKFRIHLL